MKQKDEFKCQECEETFDSQEELEEHEANCAPEEEGERQSQSGQPDNNQEGQTRTRQGQGY